MDSLSDWLERLGLERYAPRFAENGVDIESVRLLTESDLEGLGLLLGHRKKLLKAIGELNSTQASPLTRDAKAGPSLQEQGSAEGERRQATVMFSDLAGYTAMNERLDPEEVRAIVARIKAAAVRIIEAQRGLINQFVGDEIMALFGIPRAHEDDPARAVRAAREMHSLVRNMSPEVEQRIGAPLRLHTGISSGLIVTNRADRRDGTYGVTGDAVNTGARLASHAQADQVLVSEETQRLIADFFQSEALPPVELKGKAARVTPYLVLRQTGASSRFDAAAGRGLTRYAGRDVELRTLLAALEQARSGQGQFVAVSGEPGMGKSRLLFEFRHSLERDSVAVLEGRCQSEATDTAYLPFIDVLRRGLQLDQVPATETMHDYLVSGVRGISVELERFLPFYLHLCSIPSDHHTLPPLQGDGLRRGFEEALAALLTENARQRPIVLIFEDWHWADEASDAALKYLVALVSHHRIQLVVTHRPEYQRTWSDPEYHTTLVLQPLGEPETASMLCSVWNARTLPAGLATQIHARCGGNALFTEEVARQLVERGEIRVQDGAVLLERELAGLQLPNSLHAVIGARVDRLDPDAREVLRLASVIGREFSRPLLEALHPNPASLPAALDRLARAGLIYPLRVVPEPVYLFKHALVQDVVYETLLLSQRKALHERAGKAIEAQHGERLEEYYDQLAHHYSHSENLEKAIEYLEKAGDKSTALYTIRDSVNKYSAVLDRLHDLQDNDAGKRKRIEVNLKLITAGWTQPSPKFFAYLEESTRYARELQDTASLARLAWASGRLPWMLGEVARAKAQLLEALRLAKSTHQSALQRTICMDLVNICTQAADYSEALRFGDAAYDPGELPENLLSNTGALLFSSWAQASLGDFTTSHRTLSKQHELAERLQSVFMQAWGGFWLGLNCALQGDWDRSLVGYNAAIPYFQAMGDSYGIGLTIASRGYPRFMTGDISAAKRDFEGKLLMQQSGSTLGLPWILGCEAEMWLCLGDHSRLTALTTEALALRSLGQRVSEVRSRFLGAAARALATDTMDGDGIEAVEAAIKLAEQLGERPTEAWAHLRYAELLHRAGARAGALDRVAQAERMFQEMQMTWWTQQASAVRDRISGRAAFPGFVPVALARTE